MSAFRVPLRTVNWPLLRERKPKQKQVSAETKREREAPGHLSKIRLMPCCACGKLGPSEAHHLKSGRGKATKGPNRSSLPLCWEDHQGPQGVERAGSRNEIAWFKARGIANPYELAEALFMNNYDIVLMHKILHQHMGEERRGE